MFRKLNRKGLKPRWLPIPIAISLLLACSASSAAEQLRAARYVIEQPSQNLGEALQAIARQTSTSVLFDPRAVAGRLARPVSGRLSGVEAIATALEGSGLEAHVTQDGVVVVRPVAAGAGPAGPAAPAAPAGSAPAMVRTGTALQSARDQAIQASPGDNEVGADNPKVIRDGVHEITRVEVTGSRLKRVDSDGPAPVNVYTKKDIEQSGQPTLQRFLANLNEVSASAGEGGFANTLGQGTVQLRGLPLGSTLVLINGRRVQAMGSSAANFFNLNLIPMAAIERVEVVPVGSSAVYGGDALAGVVNVVLKKSIDGQSVSVGAGKGRGFSDSNVSLATGGSSAEGSYLLMGSYSRTTPLTMVEREFFLDADYRRFGGVDARVRYCTPGTVSSLNGGNLPGLNSSFAGIPANPAGRTLGVADFQASAGVANLCNLYANNNGITLVHGTKNLGLHALGERKLGGGWTVFGEFTYADERLEGKDLGLSVNFVTVAAGNPFNPFGEDVMVTGFLGPENGLQGLARQTKFTRTLVGVRGEVGSSWDVELTASTVRDRGGSQSLNANVDYTARAAALAATATAAALNPFTVGRAASEEVLRGIWKDNIRHSNGRKDQLGGLLRGTAWQLPAGPLEVVVGAEAARDYYDVSFPSQGEFHDSRRDSAAYGEMRAPLWRAAGVERGGWDLAALTVAARRDRYSDFGSANTYQAGLEVRPSRSFLIRASAATSFKPPTLLQTNVDDSSYDAQLFGLVDPARGGEPVTSGTVVRTTNKALQPERGRAHAFGAVWEPEGSLGTRLSVSQWQVRIRGLIALLQPQTALNHEDLFPGFVTRGPSINGQPGMITSIKQAEVNYGSVDSAGTDLDAGYAWRNGVGRWTVAAGATRASKYRVVLAPGTEEENRLGRRFDDFWAPRWKGRLSVGLDEGSWNLALTSRYLGRYRDSDSAGSRLGNVWVHDLAGSLNLKKLWPGLAPRFKAASVSLSIANVTDREPQFVQNVPYYDVTQADWRGRYASARLSLDW